MSDVVSLFEKKLKEALEGPEAPSAQVLKVALQYILAAKLPQNGQNAGSGFKEDGDE
jgi:hypothetical protein